ncbi:hypothetical protein MKW92_037584 [Papaver armeniacum]|nr:hypothetical protein MKW92_037584 [Papaver armeniacum]
MEDSFQPPVPDCAPDDAVHKDQQKPIEEGYASSISTDYSEEVSAASSSDDDSYEPYPGKIDGKYDDDGYEPYPCKIDGKYVGIYACLNKDNSGSDVSDPTESSSEEEAIPQSESDAFDKAVEHFYSSKPTKSTWKMSWPKEAKLGEPAWVNVYGHYSKQTDSGGYAVILRNMSAEPIAASAKFSPDGKSFFFQVLDGLVAGFRLAEKHGCSTPDVRCNSDRVVTLLSQVASRSCNCEGSKIGKICKKCTSAILPFTSDQSFETLVPLIKTLQGKKLDCTNFDCVTRKMNEAAHYLAKETKKKALLNKKLLMDKKRKTLVDYMENWEPNEFSDDLVSILLDDAFDTLYYNSDSMTRIAQSFSSCNS